LFREPWKPQTRAGAADARRDRGQSSPSQTASAGSAKNSVSSRHSNGLEQFFGYIQGESGLNILDFSGASQANISFITNLGHKLYAEDLLQTLDTAFGEGDFYHNQSSPERIERFLRHSLDFPENHFDGALVWDLLEYLSPPLLKATVDRLSGIVKPRSYLLAIFHAEERAELVSTYSYRIADAGTLLLSLRGMRKPAQLFNNRAVEKLFQSFESVKFFLTRDHLREVVVKR
jgi:hypothetical protein